MTTVPDPVETSPEDRKGEPPTLGRDGPDPHPRDIAGMHRRLRWLKERVRTVKADLSSLTEEIGDLEDALVQDMAAAGMTSAVFDGFNGYLNPKRHVERLPDVGPDQVIAAMRAAGLDYMVKPGYSANTFKAYLCELVDGGLPIPPELAEVVVLKTDFEVRFVKAPARRSRRPAP